MALAFARPYYYYVKHSFIQIKTKTVLLYGLIHWKRSPPAQRHRCSLYVGQLSSLLVHVVSHFDDLPEIADQIMVIVQVLVYSELLVGWTNLDVGLAVYLGAVPAGP